MTQRN